jgi:hypothetical protein
MVTDRRAAQTNVNAALVLLIATYHIDHILECKKSSYYVKPFAYLFFCFAQLLLQVHQHFFFFFKSVIQVFFSEFRILSPYLLF